MDIRLRHMKVCIKIMENVSKNNYLLNNISKLNDFYILDSTPSNYFASSYGKEN
jgi:hypothetical protein